MYLFAARARSTTRSGHDGRVELEVAVERSGNCSNGSPYQTFELIAVHQLRILANRSRRVAADCLYDPDAAPLDGDK